MIINGKKVVDPESISGDFKEVFLKLTALGAGMPIERDGRAAGVWTPSLLAEAMTLEDRAGSGPDRRTVQLWFQDNEKSVSRENIFLLARVFGCGDHALTTKFQAALIRSVEVLIVNRRVKRVSKKESRVRRNSLAGLSDRLFSENQANLAFSVFGFAVILCFCSAFLGIHSITYEISRDVHKQVGFLWAPNWSLMFLIFMPLYLWFVSDVVRYWKFEILGDVPNEYWMRRMDGVSYLLWLVLVICLLVAGVLQWVFSRLLPSLNGGRNFALDWGSLGNVRPDVLTIPQEVVFTATAYLYMSLCFYLFFAGLILLFSIIRSHAEASAAGSKQSGYAVPLHLMKDIFRCTILAIIIAVLMKLQSSYLSSAGLSIVQWFLSDLGSIFGIGELANQMDGFISLNHFSSLVLVVSAVFVFGLGYSKFLFDAEGRRIVKKMAFVVACLSISYLLIGSFNGFAIPLSASLLLSIYGLFNPSFGSQKLSVPVGD